MKIKIIHLKVDFSEFSKEIRDMAMLHVNALAMRYLEMGFTPIIDNATVD